MAQKTKRDAEMTNEQINVAIAKACGWKWVRSYQWIDSNGLNAFSWDIPDYCNDLNAMNEAEKSLDDDCKNGFRLELLNVTGSKHFGSFEHIHATARQRAEAFLRTLDKWEEVQS